MDTQATEILELQSRYEALAVAHGISEALHQTAALSDTEQEALGQQISRLRQYHGQGQNLSSQEQKAAKELIEQIMGRIQRSDLQAMGQKVPAGQPAVMAAGGLEEHKIYAVNLHQKIRRRRENSLAALQA